MTTKLSVNLNAIAWLRNRRTLPWPNLLHFADIALKAGASGLTVHPRPDERHIRFCDVLAISSFLKEHYPAAEFNIEGYPTEKFLALAQEHAQQITLVPDTPEQKTSDHGWSLKKDADFLFPIIKRLKERAIRVSLFMDPECENLEIAKQMGADRVEFYTGPYAQACLEGIGRMDALEQLAQSAYHAYSLGLEINAGHDLALENLDLLLKYIPYIKEVSIGHSLIAAALEHGMEKTVQLFLQKLS